MGATRQHRIHWLGWNVDIRFHCDLFTPKFWSTLKSFPEAKSGAMRPTKKEPVVRPSEAAECPEVIHEKSQRPKLGHGALCPPLGRTLSLRTPGSHENRGSLKAVSMAKIPGRWRSTAGKIILPCFVTRGDPKSSGCRATIKTKVWWLTIRNLDAQPPAFIGLKPLKTTKSQ